jgi:hypothetical protein
MREERIWPNGLRYLWTDAFGVVVLVALYRELGDSKWLTEACGLADEVERVLGREKGIRIGAAGGDRNAITRVMACRSYFSGALLNH